MQRDGTAVLLLGKTMITAEEELKGEGGGRGGEGRLVEVFDGGCGGEEELALLPRHTKVVVTGNSRTKSMLVGLRDVVKKAVGLEGWHWLVLTDGVKVKLQRNARSVIEAPSGNEEDRHYQMRFTSRLNQGVVRVIPQDYMLQVSLSCDSQSKESASAKIDLSRLETAVRRYRWQFNLMEVIPTPSKEEVIDVIKRHFVTQQIDEAQVIVVFVKASGRMKKSRKFWDRSRLC